MTVDQVSTRRYVAHVMGMPLSLALRGRHTEDDAARRAWERCVADLTEVDRVFSTYREDSAVSRLARGEIDLADCPAEVHEVLALGEQARVESAAPSTYVAPGRTAYRPSTRAAWSRAGRSSARPRTCSLSPTPTSASPPAATWSATSPTAPAPPGGSGSRTRATRSA